MARIKASRMTDATLVSSVDNEISDLEVALSEILGIPIDTEITGAVFGVVGSDASVNGVLRFKGAGSDPVATVGVELEDSANNEKFRIVVVGGQLILYQYDTDDYPLAWEPLDILSTPVVSVEQLDEFSLLDLSTEDGKVLQIDATDPDDVKFQTITAAAAGSVAFPDLSDVSDTIYDEAESDPLDIIRINATQDGLEAVSPTIVASDVQELGDLTDVDPASIVDADRGKVLQIGWDQIGGVYKAEYFKHVFGYGAYNKETAGKPNSGMRVEGNINFGSYASWPQVTFNLIGSAPAVDGLGYDANMFVSGSSVITLPEPGPYIVETSVTWLWQYDNPQDPATVSDPSQANAPHARSHRLYDPLGGSVYFGDNLVQIYPEYQWFLPSLGAGGQMTGTPYLQVYPGRSHVARGMTMVYALQSDAQIKLTVHQKSGVDRWVQYAHVFVAKVR